MPEHQKPLSATEVAEIKDVILASVRSGAHGHMAPDALAESLVRSFRLMHFDAEARYASVPACGKVEITSDSLAITGSITLPDSTSLLQSGNVLGADVDVVTGISGAAQLRPKHGVVEAQNDFLSNAATRLTDIVNRCSVITRRLHAQSEGAGANLVKDEALALNFLLLELVDLSLEFSVLRQKLIGLQMNGKEAV